MYLVLFSGFHSVRPRGVTVTPWEYAQLTTLPLWATRMPPVPDLSSQVWTDTSGLPSLVLVSASWFFTLLCLKSMQGTILLKVVRFEFFPHLHSLAMSSLLASSSLSKESIATSLPLYKTKTVWLAFVEHWPCHVCRGCWCSITLKVLATQGHRHNCIPRQIVS